MGNSIGQMAPLLIVLSLAGYCCWVEENDPPKQGPDKEKISKLEITPVASSVSVPEITRSPFDKLTPGSKKSGAKNKEGSLTFDKNSGLNPSPKNLVENFKNLMEKSNEKLNENSSKESPKPANEAKPDSSYVLRGTFIYGQRRLAMINDRFFTEGEFLVPGKSAGNTKDPLSSYQVAGISPDKVILRTGMQTSELKFPTPEKKNKNSFSSSAGTANRTAKAKTGGK